MNSFATSQSSHNYLMIAGPLACGVNTPPARTTRQHGLPPYAPRGGFLVDEYPACPEHWLRSKGSTASCFVGVDEGTGLWLDLNRTLERTPQHVAMVISIQGVNALTGMPCEDAQLEQYVEKCPKHKKEFGPNRFCAECNFQWPKQNYLCSTGQPLGELWLDGFRAVDGIIRQYVFTQNKARGVANAIIGEKRVFAIGISCFLSKTARPPEPSRMLRGGPVFGYSYSHGGKLGSLGGDEPLGMIQVDAIGGNAPDNETYTAYFSSSVASKSLSPDDMPVSKGMMKGEPIASASASKGMSAKGMMKSAPNAATYSASLKTSRLTGRQNVQARMMSVNHVAVQQVEVAAGEVIDQKIYDDPHPLDFWHDKPESILVINYALVVDAQKILEGGKIDLKGSPEGFLANVPTGNATIAS